MAAAAPNDESARAAVIRDLYAALDRGDGDAMAASYTPDATFTDPAFGTLRGPEVGGMWRMLTARSSGIDVTLEQHAVDGLTGTAHWIAKYRFGPRQRPVTNDVRGTFTFDAASGLIAAHEDRFDLRRWGAQAIGPVAGLLGYTPLLSLSVRKRTRTDLDKHLASA